MKRFLVIIAFVLCNLFLSIAQYSSPYSNVVVYTPCNTQVSAGLFIGTDVSYTPADEAAWTLYLAQNYGAVYMGPPSFKYNCHGYAWYMTDGNNPNPINSPVWINQQHLSPYFYCYIQCAESEATKVYYHPDGNHSAIRIDSWWYQSKWGSSFLVKHPPNSCDHIYKASMTKTYWKIPSYTVSFNANGGSPTPPNQSVASGGYATRPATDPTCNGTTFVDWYTTPDCSGSPVNFATYQINSNQTFYAKWTQIYFKIRYRIINETPSELWDTELKLYSPIGMLMDELIYDRIAPKSIYPFTLSSYGLYAAHNTHIANFTLEICSGATPGNLFGVRVEINGREVGQTATFNQMVPCKQIHYPYSAYIPHTFGGWIDMTITVN